MEMEEGTFEVETKPLRTTFIIHSKRKVKCQRLPQKIKKSLQSKIHWTIRALLFEITQDYSETEKHLNILKERLLKYIETLEVPVDELNYLTNIRSILKEEEKTYILMEEYLNYLEEEITKTCSTLHTLDENVQKVQKEIKALKHELTKLESEADELFNRDVKPDLGLPALPMEYYKLPLQLFNRNFKPDLGLPDLPMEYYKLPPLQNEVLKIGIPHALLYEMNIIQQSDEMKNMMAFLEQLYEKADHCSSFRLPRKSLKEI